MGFAHSYMRELVTSDYVTGEEDSGVASFLDYQTGYQWGLGQDSIYFSTSIMINHVFMELLTFCTGASSCWNILTLNPFSCTVETTSIFMSNNVSTVCITQLNCFHLIWIKLFSQLHWVKSGWYLSTPKPSWTQVGSGWSDSRTSREIDARINRIILYKEIVQGLRYFI